MKSISDKIGNLAKFTARINQIKASAEMDLSKNTMTFRERSKYIVDAGDYKNLHHAIVAVSLAERARVINTDAQLRYFAENTSQDTFRVYNVLASCYHDMSWERFAELARCTVDMNANPTIQAVQGVLVNQGAEVLNFEMEEVKTEQVILDFAEITPADEGRQILDEMTRRQSVILKYVKAKDGEKGGYELQSTLAPHVPNRAMAESILVKDITKNPTVEKPGVDFTCGM